MKAKRVENEISITRSMGLGRYLSRIPRHRSLTHHNPSHPRLRLHLRLRPHLRPHPRYYHYPCRNTKEFHPSSNPTPFVIPDSSGPVKRLRQWLTPGFLHVNHNLCKQLDCTIRWSARAQIEALQWDSLFHAFDEHVA